MSCLSQSLISAGYLLLQYPHTIAFMVPRCIGVNCSFGAPYVKTSICYSIALHTCMHKCAFHCPRGWSWWLWLQPWHAVLLRVSPQHFHANWGFQPLATWEIQPVMVVVYLKVGVNGLLAITLVLCSEAYWHTNAARNYLNLKIIFLFPLLIHTEGNFCNSVERDKQTVESPSPPDSAFLPMQTYLICRMKQSPQGKIASNHSTGSRALMHAGAGARSHSLQFAFYF